MNLRSPLISLLCFAGIWGLSSCGGTQPMNRPDRQPVENAPTEFFKGVQCPDLIVKDLQVLDQGRRSATVAYTIHNVGDTALDLRGRDLKSYKDNLAVKLYFSRDDKLQLGDVLIGGFYLKDDLPVNGLLLPDATYRGTIRINTKNQTSLTPYVIFDVDGWQDFLECDETNNQAAIHLE